MQGIGKSAAKRKLVLVGNGMAGMQTIEHILKLGGAFDITVIGSEPYPNYNRIMLSYVLEGSQTPADIILNDREWYAQNGITLHTGTMVTKVDTARQVVETDQGLEFDYDELIVATGSKPFVLPVPGADLEGVVGFRDIADCEAMIDAASRYRKAAVIGGGLLGLEAAKGLSSLGMEVTVVHLVDRLMERQLDAAAAEMLRDELERHGISFLMGKKTERILGSGRVSGLHFADGTSLDADLVVMAAGIVPNIKAAAASGLDVHRGIVVDDYMRTSAPHVSAVGECSEHRGICYGLVAPLFEQALVLAKRLCGVETKPYEGTVTATKLKISGVDVFSAGTFIETPQHQVLQMKDAWKRTYKKLLLEDDRIVGAVLFGDTSESARLAKWVAAREPMTDEIYAALFGGGGCCGGRGEAGGDAGVAAMSDEDIVCGCNGVTKGDILVAIRDGGLTTVDEIKACTGATRSCGGCKPMVEQLLKAALGDSFQANAAPAGICGCTPLGRDEIVAAIREKKLTHVREVMHVLGWKDQEGCSKCRPALNYYLGMVWPEEHEDERDSRFVNERLHANIQKDGSFGVIPRMYGGVTTPAELRKIANVAEKYGVEMVKVTGGQRIDLLGVSKEQLPAIWADLGMPSGFGYAKSLRTVKTCVGSQFCRFGTQDSIAMGILLEKRYEQINMPAKFKMAVNGCPRNCAESGTKDIGIVGNDGGWEIYVGGNGGIKLRAADLLCKVKTDEELIAICDAFMQYYREQAKYGERTSDFVERVGLETVRAAILDDATEFAALGERLAEALAGRKDPWAEVLEDANLRTMYYEPIRIR
ncbi:nitrite reductase large subunit NirB [Paenibacillus turpanensis]|uniref:nitrite reductase large subunit NirB n=1 Tax=Paenibacillus turpanensis TaxID=2689078 RepID=UPI00140CFF6F|nr:nitrite reductase large subunit NirB [Paenibacillus turpanensis]